MTVPPLKTDPKYGYFPWWPEDGDDWVHPEDVAAARSMIPSERVFRRDGTSGPYLVMHYGELRLRVRRTLWKEVARPRFEIGDWVEVLTRGQTNSARTATIHEVLWDEHAQEVRYKIIEASQPVDHRYAESDLQRVDSIASN